ncbi:MAG: DUF5666 domain-containing protein [Acidobacteriota bacterium]
MRTKIVSIGLAIVFVLLGFQSVWADKPNPGATPPGLERSTERGSNAPNTQQDKPNGRHAIFGTVTGKSGSTFTVSTKQGAVVVTVTPSTRIHLPGKRNATLADIAIGDRVAVNGTPTKDGLTAKQVAVAPGKPTVQHRVGKVTAYTAGSSITIETVQGKSETFAVNGQTVIRNPKGSGVAVGDRVTIVARRVPATDTFTARAIVVHPN